MRLQCRLGRSGSPCLGSRGLGLGGFCVQGGLCLGNGRFSMDGGHGPGSFCTHWGFCLQHGRFSSQGSLGLGSFCLHGNLGQGHGCFSMHGGCCLARFSVHGGICLQAPACALRPWSSRKTLPIPASREKEESSGHTCSWCRSSIFHGYRKAILNSECINLISHSCIHLQCPALAITNLQQHCGLHRPSNTGHMQCRQ